MITIASSLRPLSLGQHVVLSLPQGTSTDQLTLPLLLSLRASDQLSLPLDTMSLLSRFTAYSAKPALVGGWGVVT